MKPMNLKELLEKHKVEIPMLQRDYAQGRKSQENVAKAFLDSIFSVLDGKKESLHIDFIYGYKEGDKFILIDGQQRVTTLWLLHFYLYRKARKPEEIKLECFSYNTRKSSAKFCKNLLNKDFDMSKEPSEAISNKVGVFESAENLKNDPTIKAMLNMLDLIFERVKDGSDLSKLSSNLNKITFSLFDMREFSLGEELYIKMNARGKQLSRYENLKSLMEKGLESQDKERSRDTQKLLVSIDTQWSDYFFDSEQIELFDTRGANFLFYANLFFILEHKLERGEKIQLNEYIEKFDHSIDESFYELLQKRENIKLLDFVIESRKLFQDYKIHQTSFFNNKKLDYKSICYFFAILYLARRVENNQKRGVENDKEILNANDYLRVCKHFIENHTLDNSDDIKSFLKLFKHLLSEGFEDIYQFLVRNRSYSFNANIYKLEVRKARLILESRSGGEEWEEILNKTSDHSILLGWVDFLLDFSDEKFEYKSYEKDLNYKKPILDKFKQYANLTMSIFDKNFLGSMENLTLFKRAFLCIGNYGFHSTNWFYGNVPLDLYRDREAMNWILSGKKNDQEMPYFKKFLDQLIEYGANKDNLREQMQKIIDSTDLSTKEWWEQLLIGQKEMFAFIDGDLEKFQQYRRIRFFNENLRLQSGLEKITKVELLPGTKNKVDVRCLLDFAFYHYCKTKTELEDDVSEYECDEEQYNYDYSIESHFNINGMEVFCNSKESKITIGDKEFDLKLQLGNKIFDQFDDILKPYLEVSKPLQN